jgi:hypothetical protein
MPRQARAAHVRATTRASAAASAPPPPAHQSLRVHCAVPHPPLPLPTTHIIHPDQASRPSRVRACMRASVQCAGECAADSRMRVAHGARARPGRDRIVEGRLGRCGREVLKVVQAHGRLRRAPADRRDRVPAGRREYPQCFKYPARTMRVRWVGRPLPVSGFERRRMAAASVACRAAYVAPPVHVAQDHSSRSRRARACRQTDRQPNRHVHTR